MWYRCGTGVVLHVDIDKSSSILKMNCFHIPGRFFDFLLLLIVGESKVSYLGSYVYDDFMTSYNLTHLFSVLSRIMDFSGLQED